MIAEGKSVVKSNDYRTDLKLSIVISYSDDKQLRELLLKYRDLWKIKQFS